MPIADHKMAEYKSTAHKRWLREQDELSLSYDRAWTVAKKAAAILRSQFGIQRVVVIGSLTHQQRYHRRSDVDLVVWELSEKKYYRAVAQLLNLDPTHEIDLVRVEDVSDSFKKHIDREGIEL